MEKEFIPYELAVKLKTLGFDEPCLAYFDAEKVFKFPGTTMYNRNFLGLLTVTAPTFSQAFRWFREKQAIEGFIHKAIEGTYYFVIKRLGNNESNIYEFITNAPKNVDTYEEAELNCVKKLIELIENK